MYMNCELSNAELWLKSAVSQDSSLETTMSLRQPVEKYYFLSVSKVSYGRETLTKPQMNINSEKSGNIDSGSSAKDGGTPTHRLVVHNLKGAWTKNNRNVVFSLYDSFYKIQQLKKNLSKDSLKEFKAKLIHRLRRLYRKKCPTHR